MYTTEFPNDYLTVKQAATYVGRSEKTIRNYIKGGRLRAVRLGPRSIRISIDHIGNLYSDLERMRPYN
jgi:excisionase family DNA binding protein